MARLGTRSKGISMARWFVAIAAATVASLACAVPAMGATPFTAGTGYGPDLAVGSDGTGHVAWLTDEEPEDRVGYCRVPAGGSACDGESGFLDFPGTDAFSLNDQAQVFTPAPSVVIVLGSCFSCGDGANDVTYRWISTNNGVDFAGPVAVGSIDLVGQASYLDLAGDVILGTSGKIFQAMDAAAPSPDTLEPEVGGDGLFVYSPAVVYDPATDKFVHVVNDLATVRFAYRTDATPTAAELNNLGGWSINNTLSAPEGDNDETHLSAGTNGIFLTYRYFNAGNTRVGLRKFSAATNTFGAPVYVDGENAVDNNSLDMPHHSQDASGRLHVVYRTLHEGNRLRYTRSNDGGVSFAAHGNLAANETFIDPIVEAGPSGAGWAVWKGIGTSPIRVVLIDPQPEPVDPPPPGGPDTTAPSAEGFRAGDTSLLPGQGTSFSFSSSEAGTAILTVRKLVPGLKVRKGGRRRCVPRTRRLVRRLAKSTDSRAELRRLLRKRSCKARKRIGSIRKTVAAGENAIVWNGRIAGRKLRPGRYIAELQIRDSAGNLSRLERVRFRVLKPRRRG